MGWLEELCRDRKKDAPAQSLRFPEEGGSTLEGLKECILLTQRPVRGGLGGEGKGNKTSAEQGEVGRVEGGWWL